MQKVVKLLVVGMLVALSPSVLAQESESDVKLHGFGTWFYSKTNNDNGYLSGSKRGEYENAKFALNVTATPVDKLVVNAQVGFIQEGDRQRVNLDYAFAEYRFSKYLRLRAGQVKQTFGIYSEYYDLGTNRPFISLPQSIYGGFYVGRAYKGVGISGSVDLGSWGVDYDAYAGSLGIESGAAEQQSSLRDVVGTRVNVRTPVPGLRAGASVYRASLDFGIFGSFTPLATAGHVEYVNDKMTLRSEVARNAFGGSRLHSAYVEAGYKLSKHWQAAGLFDYAAISFDLSTLPPIAIPPPGAFPEPQLSLNEHKDRAVGLNYWFNDNVVLKSSYHFVAGNFYAKPVTAEPVFYYPNLKPDTRGLQFGVQFSF
jgi:hypothetical protein